MHGFQTIVAGLAQGLAQQMNLAAQGVRADFLIGPEQVFQRPASDDTARVKQQGFEYLHAARHQVERLIVHIGDTLPSIQAQATGLQQIADHRAARAPLQHLHAHGDFGQRIGFDQVIIRAQRQRIQFAGQRIAGRQHQHRRGQAQRIAQIVQHGLAVGARQTQIQNDDIVSARRQPVLGGLAVVGDIHLMALQLQILDQVGQNGGVVFHHQQLADGGFARDRGTGVRQGSHRRRKSASQTCENSRMRKESQVKNNTSDDWSGQASGLGGLQRIWRAGVYSRDGLVAAFRHEAAFRQELLLVILLLPLALWLPASGLGKAMMVASLLLVLIVELLNSAVEATIDRISTEHHPLAKRAKDLGSAAVLIALLNVPAVWLLVLFG